MPVWKKRPEGDPVRSLLTALGWFLILFPGLLLLYYLLYHYSTLNVPAGLDMWIFLGVLVTGGFILLSRLRRR